MEKFSFQNLYTFDFTENNKMKMKLYNSANCTLIPSQDENIKCCTRIDELWYPSNLF